jgi:hypothetical protein
MPWDDSSDGHCGASSNFGTLSFLAFQVAYFQFVQFLLQNAPLPIADTTAVATSGPTSGICCSRTQAASFSFYCVRFLF